MKTRCCYPKRYLLLFFSLLVSVGSILMSVSLSSCSSSVKSPLLLSADSLMEIYPDSALYPFWNQFPPHRNYHVLTEHFMRYCLRKQGIKIILL